MYQQRLVQQLTLIYTHAHAHKHTNTLYTQDDELLNFLSCAFLRRLSKCFLNSTLESVSILAVRAIASRPDTMILQQTNVSKQTCKLLFSYYFVLVDGLLYLRVLDSVLSIHPFPDMIFCQQPAHKTISCLTVIWDDVTRVLIIGWKRLTDSSNVIPDCRGKSSLP